MPRSCLGLLPPASRQQKQPSLGFARRFASYGVAVKRVERMEVRGRADETQDRAQVA
jgi:hypothetical protein